MSWSRFYEQLRRWENEFDVKLVLRPEDFGIHRRPTLPIPYGRSEIIRVEVVGPGWLRGETLALTEKRDRCITLINADRLPVGAKLKARIISNKDNIFIAEPLI